MWKMRRGQVMILTILALGGTILGATTIAGLLTLDQIRLTTNANNSARAIFAADAGLEWAFYNLTCSGDSTKACPLDKPAFSNGASVTVICFDKDGNSLDDKCNVPGVQRIRSVGTAAADSRAFEARF